MKPELQERLYKKYPELFVQHTWDMRQTCMCWGIACGGGWYAILEKLCSTIMYYCREAKKPVPNFTQVKEKFGTLRVYHNSGDTIIDALVDRAESESESTCEECGDFGQLIEKGWVQTLCPVHTEPANQTDTNRRIGWRYMYSKIPWKFRGPIYWIVSKIIKFSRWGVIR